MSLYETDFHAWTRQQAELLRQRKLDQADIDNLIEEVESWGKDQARRLRSAYRLVAMHLLKLIHQPEMATNSWRGTIVRGRANIQIILKDNPSLKPRRQELFDEAYAIARREAAAETGLPLAIFPVDPPFMRQEVEDDDFSPSA